MEAATRIWFDSESINRTVCRAKVSITFKGETFWYVYNGHGDVMAMTDKDGNVVARYEYDAWGLVTGMYNRYGERVREGIGWIGDLGTGNGGPGSVQGPEDDSGNTVPDYHPGNGNGKAKGKEIGDAGDASTESSVLTEGESTETQTVTLDLSAVITEETEPTEDITTDLVKENPFRYAGYYFDRKTQYYYLQARYYDPRPARFISEDTYEGEIENPQSLNQYVYVENNPLVNIDPSGQYCVSIDGNWAQPGTCKSPSSIYMGPDSDYIGRPIINRGVVHGRLVSNGKTERESKPENGNYWKKYGLEAGFLGTWYANPKTLIQVLEFIKADILRNGSIDTHKYVDSGSVYIQAVVVAISTGKGRDFGNEVISGIENIQAMYDFEDREKGVVDLDTINALIDNYKKKPEWLHKFNGAAYKLDWNFGEEFYQAVVYGIAGGSASKGTGEGASKGTGNAFNRGATNTSELNTNQFKGLKNNGVIKVNSSGSNRPVTGAPNSYYTTANGEHVFVYDGQGKLIYDLSADRVKAFKINVNPAGQEFYQPYKLDGSVPQFIKKLFGW